MNVQYLANLVIVIHVHTTVLPNHYKFQDINDFFLDFDHIHVVNLNMTFFFYIVRPFLI